MTIMHYQLVIVINTYATDLGAREPGARNSEMVGKAIAHMNILNEMPG